MSDLEGAPDPMMEDRLSELESAVARHAAVIDQNAAIINAQGNLLAVQTEALASLLKRLQDVAPAEPEAVQPE